MAKKKRATVNEYDLHVYARSDNRDGWYAVFTWYQNEKPIATVTASDHSLVRLVETCNRHMWRVQQEMEKGQLVLPDDGDYQIRYFSTPPDQGTIDNEGPPAL